MASYWLQVEKEELVKQNLPSKTKDVLDAKQTSPEPVITGPWAWRWPKRRIERREAEERGTQPILQILDLSTFIISIWKFLGLD